MFIIGLAVLCVGPMFIIGRPTTKVGPTKDIWPTIKVGPTEIGAAHKDTVLDLLRRFREVLP